MDLDAPTALELADWLIAYRVNLSKASWRQYRAALKYFFTCPPNNGPSLEDSIVEALERLKQTLPPGRRPKIKKTSAKKLKKISETDLIKLFDCLYNEKSGHGKATIQWLLASLCMGLRPCEWERAFYLPSTGKLVVVNAKATQGRSHGGYRHLNLAKLDGQMLSVIQLHLEDVRKAKLQPGKNGKSGFSQFYEACRHWLHRANKKLWPRRKQTIALYSTRHQFAADAKFSGLPMEAIAALMGHQSTETQTSHYARKSAGRNGFQVAADEQDMARELNSIKIDPRKIRRGLKEMSHRSLFPKH